MMARSIKVSAFHAATTPMGTATQTARMSVTAISESVGSARCAINVATGRLVKIEVPRSPWRICQSHSPKRIRNGRSRPKLMRMRATSSGVA